MNIKGLKVAVLGGRHGLLGQSLTRSFTESGAEVLPLGRADCDIIDPHSVAAILDQHKPELLINAAAYTQVDLAEEEEEAAFALNATAPPLLGTLAAERDIPIVHYGTDFVFRGNQHTPRKEDDQANPFSVYGISKLDGERGLLKLDYAKTLIIRIAWLFGPGRVNFVEKILSLCESRDTLQVVNDQTGSPSYAPDIAQGTIRLLEHDACGLYHLANSGETTWYGLASAAVKLAELPCEVQPVPSSAYPTKAMRPPYSVLDLTKYRQTTGATPRHWREALKTYVTDYLI